MVIYVPGGYFFFSISEKKKILKKHSVFFQTKKKERGKQNCGRLSGHNFGRPLDRKQTFFLRVALFRALRLSESQ